MKYEKKGAPFNAPLFTVFSDYQAFELFEIFLCLLCVVLVLAAYQLAVELLGGFCILQGYCVLCNGEDDVLVPGPVPLPLAGVGEGDADAVALTVDVLSADLTHVNIALQRGIDGDDNLSVAKDIETKRDAEAANLTVGLAGHQLMNAILGGVEAGAPLNLRHQQGDAVDCAHLFWLGIPAPTTTC